VVYADFHGGFQGEGFRKLGFVYLLKMLLLKTFINMFYGKQFS
jgi:hypothetical protein